MFSGLSIVSKFDLIFSIILHKPKMFKLVTKTHAFIAGIFTGMVNTSVLTYILIDNERLNHKREILQKTILASQMR